MADSRCRCVPHRIVCVCLMLFFSLFIIMVCLVDLPVHTRQVFYY